ncbi:hypothetical protein [Priestia megaterium]|nr:hypothetical protein [Priestia megaterium]MDM8148501.1 hypothetical protein [Priestia megaterium]
MTTALIGLSVGFYGTAMATSTRKDLSVHYVRLSAEIAKICGRWCKDYDK